MGRFNKERQSLTIDVELRYNRETNSVELTPAEGFLSKSGLRCSLPLDTIPGFAAFRELSKHMPDITRAAAVTHRLPYSPVPTPKNGKRYWSNIPLGVGEGDKEICWDATRDGHMLLTGGTGAGKSVAQRNIISHLSRFPNEWEAHIIDLWGVGLGTRSSGSIKVHHDPETAELIISEMAQRVEGTPLEDENTKWTMLIIDDIQSLLSQEDTREEVASALEQLVNKGAEHKIAVCVSGQNSNLPLLTKSLHHLFPVVYVTGRLREEVSLEVVGTISAAQVDERQRGQGVIKLRDGAMFIQGYHADFQ